MPPDLSLTAMIFIPCCSISEADTDPTLPNPWTATRVPCTGMWRRLSAWRVTSIQPRPVASRLPSEPPISTGLPVTTAVTVCRLCME